MANQIGDLKVGIGVESTVDQDLKKAEKSLRDFGQEAKKVGQDVQQGMDQADRAIESTIVKSEKALTARQKRLISSVENQALRRTSESESAYLQQRLLSAGISEKDFPPMLAKLREQEAALQDTASAYQKVGMTAKQTRQAMRLLPAQITDIVTSLASGMPMYLVAIQQGGQLRDSFGGFGNILKGVLALLNPFTVAMTAMAGAGVAAYLAYERSQGTMRQFERTLISTGNASGLTSNELTNMANSLTTTTKNSSAVVEALNAIAGSSSLVGQSYESMAQAAIKWADVTGQEVTDVVKEFEMLGKSPADAIEKLDKKYNFLTASAYRQIQALLRQGDQIQATKITVDALADTMEQRAPLMAAQVSTLSKVWDDVSRSVKNAWNSMLGFESLDSQLSALQSRLLDLENQRAKFGSSENNQFSFGIIEGIESEINATEASIKKIVELIDARELEAKQMAANNAIKQISVQASRTLIESMTDEEKLQANLAKLMATYTSIIETYNLTTAERLALEKDVNLVAQGFVDAYLNVIKTNKDVKTSVRDVNKEIREQIENYAFETSLLIMNNEERQNAIFSRDLEVKGIKQGTSASKEYMRQYAEEVKWREILNEQIDLEGKSRQNSIDTLRSTEEAIDTMTQFAVQAARNIENILGDTLYNTLKGNFTNIGDAFADMILRMSSQLISSQIATALFGNFGTSNQIGGLLGQIGSAVMGYFGGNYSSAGTPVPSTYGSVGELGSFGGLAEGGYTGNGSKYEPAGIVHRGEYVLNAHATKKIGIPTLNRMNKGYADGGYVGGSSYSTGAININITNEAGREGYKATAQAKQNNNGGIDVEVLVRRAVSSDLQNNGALSQQMANVFGLRRNA